MKNKTLTERVYAIGIHGITGRMTDEGWLEAGAIVRNIRETEPFAFGCEGKPVYRFDASTDGGETWFTQETAGEPKTT